MRPGRGWGRGRSGQGKDLDGCGRGAGRARSSRGAAGDVDSLGGATDSVLQTPLQSILQKHTENAVVLIPVVNRQFVILQQE